MILPRFDWTFSNIFGVGGFGILTLSGCRMSRLLAFCVFMFSFLVLVSAEGNVGVEEDAGYYYFLFVVDVVDLGMVDMYHSLCDQAYEPIQMMVISVVQSFRDLPASVGMDDYYYYPKDLLQATPDFSDVTDADQCKLYPVRILFLYFYLAKLFPCRMNGRLLV
mgnify:CR=1 FL=1